MHVYLFDSNFPITNVYSSMAMTTCGVAMGFSVILPKILCNPEIKPAKKSYMMALLPMSLLHKYMVVLMLALLTSVSIALISLLLEMIINLLITSSSLGIEIEVGGILTFFVQNRIFLLGVRSDKAKKTNSEGYGIGLHVVKQILTDFDCVIRVLNNENPTIFEIKIPRKLYSYKLI